MRDTLSESGLPQAWRDILTRMLRSKKHYKPAGMLAFLNIWDAGKISGGTFRFTDFDEYFRRLLQSFDLEGSRQGWLPYFHLCYRDHIWILTNGSQVAEITLDERSREKIESVGPDARVAPDLMEFVSSVHGREALRSAVYDMLAQDETPECTALIDSDRSCTQISLKALEGSVVFDPATVEDGRSRIQASIAVRRGQKKFREALLRAYGERCAMSASNCEEVLEAAHIYPYLGDQTNHITNGLLLRADLHSLFDLGLISVEADYTLIVSNTLLQTEYADLMGRALRLPSSISDYPNRNALGWHRARSRIEERVEAPYRDS